MANPALVACAADSWTLVASGVTAGTIYNMRPEVQYLQTYRMSGDPAPTDGLDAVPAFIYKYDPLGISAAQAIDVYLMAAVTSGLVRVDL